MRRKPSRVTPSAERALDMQIAIEQVRENRNRVIEEEINLIQETAKGQNVLCSIHKPSNGSQEKRNVVREFDKLQKMAIQHRDNPSPTPLLAYGNAGFGKSTFLNCIIGEHILPTDVGEHVTKSIFQINYGEKYSDGTVIT